MDTFPLKAVNFQQNAIKEGKSGFFLSDALSSGSFRFHNFEPRNFRCASATWTRLARRVIARVMF